MTLHENHHVHDPQEQRAILNRLSRALGHLERVRHMVEEDRDCSEVLIQLSAVEAALRSTGKRILRHHLEHCVVEASRSGDQSRLEEFGRALDQFIR